MTNLQFKEAANIALNKPDIPLLNANIDISIFHGFGLCDFKPVYCTVDQVAALIRWQCQYLLGGFDAKELNAIQQIGRHKFNII